MAEINVDNLGRRTLGMAERRGIDLGQYSIEEKWDCVDIDGVNEIPVSEFVEQLQEIADEHVDGDLSLLSIHVEVEALVGRTPYSRGEGINAMHCDIKSKTFLISFVRPETDEEAARRVMAQYDREAEQQ